MEISGITLVLGGQRSGKSAYGESLFAPGRSALYLATAEAGDDEMTARIAAHRARRGGCWTTLEEPLDIAAVLRNLTPERGAAPVLIDCLTVWLANVMAAGRDPEVEGRALCAALQNAARPVVLVSGEVGLGIVAENALARRFADALGELNQAVAAVADRVVLVAAGLPLVLKS
ncbi:bifunctional adenosylcobinamide kinase/adenosylcobinamide-phosphate guanylyltransferase [Varunaivibrio sulfuroxidans]|uniref:Bifunctional adenosylcobalamin biosynthesis protein n=2 Tax=Varunaivibrio sulfuroxidans TaxID=1773489 RepID=A0A4R3JGS9_9PROT|nr:bifunctional adenosylcobinamide kinase/adenosylcobinamide-phosphate guanylyltransferase [Varunaivibrio sulfuroxidans]TCS65142.1 adenosylcobinamide kinase /adenosylcobinamide-phosphate guanylyltransferase [Varunaivibrio sulfuroxidans]WES29573.1 bifunctional adenosylcobinamide kinase/adenosylcobinamide-phosphate guanylyltransferase [Varunaivibrio sulfuroxidans]